MFAYEVTLTPDDNGTLRVAMTISREAQDVGDAVTGEMLPAVHPGTILRDDFLAPLDLSANGLALALRVAPQRISAIVSGRRGITADTALRLARYFGTSPGFWMNIQARYDLDTARDEAGSAIEREVQPRAA